MGWDACDEDTRIASSGLSTHVGKDVTHNETWRADGTGGPGTRDGLSAVEPERSRFVYVDTVEDNRLLEEMREAVVKVPLRPENQLMIGQRRAGSCGSACLWASVGLRPSRDGQARRHPHPRLHPLLTSHPCLPSSLFFQSEILQASSVNLLAPPPPSLAQEHPPVHLMPRPSLRRVSQIHPSSWRVQNYPLRQNTSSLTPNCRPLPQTPSILCLLRPMLRARQPRNSRCPSVGSRRRPAS